MLSWVQGTADGSKTQNFMKSSEKLRKTVMAVIMP
jgi:hypothetical protein